MDTATIQLLLGAACVLCLFVSRYDRHLRAEKARLAEEAAKPLPEMRRSQETSEGLNAFIDEAEEILGLARNYRSEDDSGVEKMLEDYHNRLVLFLMKNMGSYFARRLHSHQGLRSFSSKAYPANLSSERIRVCRHIETDILRLTSFQTLIDRPPAVAALDDEDEERVMAA